MSKKSLIDSIEVKTPCSEDWNKMKGNDKVRFCDHCALEVNNISEMTRKQAMRLVRSSNGRICVRYVKNPVSRKPVFKDKLYQITRRAGLAAGVLGASLTLSSLTYAQGSPRLSRQNQELEVAAEKQLKAEKSEGSTASISGTITDPNGAVVPNVSVTLAAKGFQRMVTSNDEGFYEFTGLDAGIYSIEIEAVAGLKGANAAQSLAEGSKTVVNITLEVKEPQMLVVMGDIAVVEYQSKLHQAVSADDFETVKNLIANGEKIDPKDENHDNITPLFIAVENGNVEMVEILLSFGAQVNARDNRKQTPLMRLDEDAGAELVRVLIKYGADINLTDDAGNTALILAARSIKTEVIQTLLDHEADVNAQNERGQTALMNAAEDDNLENVRALLMAGADVNLKNKDGETAWDLTASDEIEQLLESHGAVVEEN